jgi:CelD/BcsL family acetyltransferase involved in cellulose biosynthesis
VNLHTINPLSDKRWDDLVARHPRASVFHERGWLEALNRTYSYQPFVLTSTPGSQQLSSGLALCCVSSWISGTRWVSLPFADHCDPLLDDPADLSEFTKWLRAECDRQAWNYVELRPMLCNGESSLFTRDQAYILHTLDLRPTLEQIFRGLHKDSSQRRIRRAEREGLSYETGCSEQLVRDFYRILVMTRKRHQVPPQPRTWFRNLIECMGDKAQIRLARKNGIPVAALLTLRHRSSVVYKYGCSDERFHHLAGMPFLFWRLIEESKASGAEEIDLGRSDLDQQGLITFKDRLGAKRQVLSYYRYPQTEKRESVHSWGRRAMRQLFSVLPDSILSAIGQVLYRHMG